MTRARTRVAGVLAAATAAAACLGSGSGGSRGGTVIDARGEPFERVVCRALIGQEHSQTEITASTLLGLNARRLPARPGHESGVRAHPTDADAVVFARQLRAREPKSTELFVASIRGASAEVRLTRDDATDVEPCWNTDGSAVLFASDRGGRFALWRIGRDGGDPVPLTQPGPGSEDRAPDARAGRVVFSRWSTAAGGRSAAIWTMNPDGSGQAPLTTPPGAGSGEFVAGDHEPALAPDGSSVVFVRRTAEDRAVLVRLELPSGRTTVLEDGGGEDRLPRFLDSDRVLFARSAPAAGLRGRRLVSTALDGTDLVQLDLDARMACTGLDVIVGARAGLLLAGRPVRARLRADDAAVVVGRRTLGRFELLDEEDGSGVHVATTAFDGKEVAGVFVPFVVPDVPAADVTRARVRVTFALADAGAETRVRVSVKDYVANRYDVAWDADIAGTGPVTAEFTFASLAHVDRDGRIRIELAAELPAGKRSELTLDALRVDAFVREP